MCPFCQGNHDWSTCPVVFKPILDCEFADPVDGCCTHPKNFTPECHVGACPRLDNRVDKGFRQQFEREDSPVRNVSGSSTRQP